jgi:hypothetical protein
VSANGKHERGNKTESMLQESHDKDGIIFRLKPWPSCGNHPPVIICESFHD